MHNTNLLNLDPSAGHIVLAGIVGSTAYGLAREGSDEDRLGIFQRPTRQHLGFGPGRDSTVSHEPDVTVHELGKFISLALKCNPTITDLLWLETYDEITPLGEKLIAAREAFLSSSRVASSYIGYASSQFKKLQSRGYESFQAGMGDRNAKHTRHMFRLLEQGRQLLSTGRLTVKVSDPGWYLKVLPKLNLEQLSALFAERVEGVINTPSALPDQPDRARLEALLIDARIADIG